MATNLKRQSDSQTLSVGQSRQSDVPACLLHGRQAGSEKLCRQSEAKRVAKQILSGLTNDAEAVEALATPELESLVAARVLAPNYALHVAVEEHAQAVGKLGEILLREAVEFFLRHNRADVSRLTLAEIAEQFAKSREQAGQPTGIPANTETFRGGS